MKLHLIKTGLALTLIGTFVLLSTPLRAEVCPLLKQYPPSNWKVESDSYSRGAYWKSAVIEPGKVLCRYRTSKYIPVVISRAYPDAQPKSKNWDRSEDGAECHNSRKMCHF